MASLEDTDASDIPRLFELSSSKLKKKKKGGGGENCWHKLLNSSSCQLKALQSQQRERPFKKKRKKYHFLSSLLKEKTRHFKKKKRVGERYNSKINDSLKNRFHVLYEKIHYFVYIFLSFKQPGGNFVTDGLWGSDRWRLSSVHPCTVSQGHLGTHEHHEYLRNKWGAIFINEHLVRKVFMEAGEAGIKGRCGRTRTVLVWGRK